MLSAVRHQFLRRSARAYSQAVPETGSAQAKSPKTTVTKAAVEAAAAPAAEDANAVRHSYYVRRNTRGSIPVYTDVRMNNRYLTIIRNVEGKLEVSCRSRLSA